MTRLSDWIQVKRRYMRSVNLERDADLADSLKGYVPTPRVIDTLREVVEAYSTPGTSRAWTLTGVYGTGKTAYANLLAALMAPALSPVRKAAHRALKTEKSADRVRTLLNRSVPEEGLVRALAVGRREPLEHTLVRSLARGAEAFWANRPGRKPNAVKKIVDLRERLSSSKAADISGLPELVTEIASASGTGVLVVVDELGKLLEHAARSRGSSDLYLLQQLAEMPSGPADPPVLVVGLLHQAFSEYGQGLAATERAEWEKVQGRFGDIPFAESGEQMLRLISAALESKPPPTIASAVTVHAHQWYERFNDGMGEPYFTDVMTPDRIANVYPLHPVAAVALPTLCGRYGQNDRSLFTFLASTGQHGLSAFLEQRAAEPHCLPFVRLPQVYDYFLDAARVGGVNRLQVNRWAEVHNVIRESQGLSGDETDALKTIGTLNLIASAGPLRASREVVLAALAENPVSGSERKRWEKVLSELIERRVVTYRKQVDEFRLWQGSDFDIEGAVAEYQTQHRLPISRVLERLAPLPPVVAQRHSYQTGNLRYFECQYAEDPDALGRIRSTVDGADGVIVYWVSSTRIQHPSGKTLDGKPLVVVELPLGVRLEHSAREVLALLAIDKNEVSLQSDGVARTEVRRRIAGARDVLEDALREAFERQGPNRVWFGGEVRPVGRFNANLSEFCSRVYHRSPVLWNELINRRTLTSQGARAQRELIAALVKAHDQPRLGIQGTGPEFSMYDSLLRASGIHREEEHGWHLGRPSDSGILPIWEAIENFCLEATEQPRRLSDLYVLLEAPPYGAKRGIIPVLIAAVVLYHDDDVSVYQDGSFLPILGPHHFELLVKDPSRFSVKHFALSGIRQDLFKELDTVLRAGGANRPRGSRNATLLTVVRPLVRFAKGLPAATRNSENLSANAMRVRDALLGVVEPDVLLFDALPAALGFESFVFEESGSDQRHIRFRKALFDVLRELQQHYQIVLETARDQMRTAFDMPSGPERFREDLRVRSSYLVGKVIEPRLRSFVNAAADPERADDEWLESVVMIVADRPAANWTPDDIVAFEMKAAALARQFLNLESLQKQKSRDGLEGYESRLVTITQPTGEYEHRLFWVNRQEKAVIEKNAANLLELLRGRASDAHQQHAILITMVEQMLRPFGPDKSDSGEIQEREHKHG
jgi:hypothetical protein